MQPQSPVAPLLSELYGLTPMRIELVSRASNRTYRIDESERSLFFRLYSPNAYFGTDRDDFLFELELMVHLAQSGIPVPSPLRTRDGQLLPSLEVSGQRHYGALFPMVAGTPHRAWWPSIRDDHIISELGVLFARLHDASDCFHGSNSRYEFDLFFMLEKPLELLRAKMEGHGRTDETTIVDETANTLRSIISGLTKAPEVYGIIHGDAHVGNVLYDDRVGYSLIDFDHCAYGWRVYDIVPLFNTLELNVPDPAIVDRVRKLVLEGYESVRPLSQAERDAIPAFQFLWHIWDMGEGLVLSSTWGGPIEDQEESQSAFLDRAVRAVETNAARLLSVEERE